MALLLVAEQFGVITRLAGVTRPGAGAPVAAAEDYTHLKRIMIETILAAKKGLNHIHREPHLKNTFVPNGERDRCSKNVRKK